MSGDNAKRIFLVTGGSGLVGRGVQWALENGGEYVKRENETWHFPTSSEFDLCDAAAVRRMYDHYQPTHVIHLAACVGGLFKNMRCPADMYRQNILMNLHLIDEAHRHGVTRVISALSTCIFPDDIKLPMTEKMIHDGPPHHSNSAYAYAKRMVDVQNQAYNQQYGSTFTSIIPVNVFGPHDNYNLEDSHVIPGLLHKCYLAQRNGTPLTIMGSGKPLRQFVYSRDLARAFIWAVRSYEGTEPLIVCPSAADISIRDVATGIVDAMGFKGEVKYDTTKADGQFMKTASSEQFLTHCPDFKFTPFKDAMRVSVDWFVANYESCRK